MSCCENMAMTSHILLCHKHLVSLTKLKGKQTERKHMKIANSID